MRTAHGRGAPRDLYGHGRASDEISRSLLQVGASVCAIAALAAIYGAAAADSSGAAPATRRAARAAASATTTPVRCPLQPSPSSPGGEAWAFTQNGPPSSPRGSVSSYVHGRGSWGGGRGIGTICRQDSEPSRPARDVVLAVRGSSHVSAGVTRLGRRGVELVLNVSVAASDSPSCTVGTRGTATLFASYYQGHHDSLRFRFASGCHALEATYTGSRLVALIARNGHQVNSA